MGKPAIVTDSTAIPQRIADEMGILVAQNSVTYGDMTLLDNMVDRGWLIDKLSRDNKINPLGTSQANPVEFARVYSLAAERADTVISIHPPLELTRISESAHMGKRMLEERGEKVEIRIVTTSATSYPLGVMATEAAKMARENASVDAILNAIDDLNRRMRFFAVLSDKNAVSSGRVTRNQWLRSSGGFTKVAIQLIGNQLVPIPQERTKKKDKAIIAVYEAIKREGAIEKAGLVYVVERDVSGLRSIFSRVEQENGFSGLVRGELTTVEASNSLLALAGLYAFGFGGFLTKR